MTDLDPVIHAQGRLRITAALATLDPDESISFPRLQELLGMTAGNLSTHLRKLEDAGYLEVRKELLARRPVTWYRLSATGRAALSRHVGALERLLAALDTALPPNDEGDR